MRPTDQPAMDHSMNVCLILHDMLIARDSSGWSADRCSPRIAGFVRLAIAALCLPCTPLVTTVWGGDGVIAGDVSTVEKVAVDEIAAGGSSADKTDAGQVTFFEEQIRPLLAERCYGCHGPEVQENDLRLDSRAAILAGGASGEAAAVPGDPQASLMIQAIQRTDDLAMPPDDPLSKTEIARLERWIELGVVWPARADVPGDEDLGSQGKRGPTTMAERLDSHVQEHWAFQPVNAPDLSLNSATQNGWSRRPLDVVLRRELAKHGLVPSRSADRRTLIRRLSFDLLGLPPSAQATADFIADTQDDAYDRLVDRFLASPLYGERWGRHWMDVARYADTRGYAFGRDRRYPFAYTYRDYVVRSLNGDLPYDQFIREQLAADLLDSDKRWPLAGLGFLTVGRKYNNRHDDIDEQIDVVTRGFLGMTVACARCHDHKYDAISSEDYYALYGVFASTHEPGELPLIGDPAAVERNQVYIDELKRRQKAFDDFAAEQHREIVTHARARLEDYLVSVSSPDAEKTIVDPATASFGAGELRPKLQRDWLQYLTSRARPDHPSLSAWALLVKTNLPADQFKEAVHAALDRWDSDPGGVNRLVRERIAATPPAAATDVARIYGELLTETHQRWMQLGADDAAIAKLPHNYRQLAILLFDPATPTAVKQSEIAPYLVRDVKGRYNELKASIDAHHTKAPDDIHRAMVLLDRRAPVDAHVFLRGNPRRKGPSVPRRYLSAIAAAQDDDRDPRFVDGSGRLELADRIASRSNPLTARVMANRVWMHHFGRPIVETPSDFGIRSPAPHHRELLDYLAWYLMKHDWSLKALHREIVLSAAYRQSSRDRSDGHEVDPGNQLFWRANRRRLEFEPLRDAFLYVAGRLDLRMGGRSQKSLDPPFPPRRSVYIEIDRQDLPNLLRAFDLASPDQSAEKRAETTVPQQALFLMNSPFMLEMATAVADRICGNGESRDPAATVASLYQLFFQRAPLPEEWQVAERLLSPNRQADDALALKDRWRQLAQVLLLTNEFCFLD